nr:hyalin-like [Lytechinus pictus]
MKFEVIFVVLVCCLLSGEAQFPEECHPDQCPANEPCYNRYYSTASEYVCQCDNNNVGYDCSVDVFATSQQTCYGSSCTNGIFTSPNWPSDYDNLDARVYLIFVPLAIRLSFTFDPNFAVAFGDELYIGAGLTFNIDSDLNAASDPAKQVYFFRGNSAPSEIKLDTDSAWLFWRTDNVVTSDGFQVTWEATLDAIPPDVECPVDQFFDVSAGTTSSQIFYQEPTASDKGQVRILDQSHRPGDLFPSDDKTIVVYRFEDASGNVAPACLFYIYVLMDDDNIPPVVDCPDDFTEYVQLGVTSAEVFFEEPKAVDNGGPAHVFAYTHEPGDTFPLGSTLVTYTYVDIAGNLAPECLFNVIVMDTSEDTTPPVVNCPSDISRPVTFGMSFLEVTFPDATATDNSGMASFVSVFPPSGSSFSLGTTDVIFSFIDPSDNIGSCTFTVTIYVADTSPPDVTCPADIDRSVPRGVTSLEVFFPTATATDDSGTTSLVSVDPPSGSSFPLGPTEVRFTFEDDTGNEGYCTFVITINTLPDTTPPVVICPSNITRPVLPGVTSLEVFFPTATATDESGTTSLVSVDPPSGSSFPLGPTDVRFTFEDDAGNEGYCTLVITITTIPDTTPPVVICPSNITRPVLPGVTSLEVDFATATATDDSGTTSLFSVDPPSGSSFPLGPTEVSFVFKDESGNEGSCTFFISIVTSTIPDTTPPVVICPPNITRSVLPGVTSLEVIFPTATATDESGTTSLVSVNPPSGSSFPLGPTDVRFTFEDDAGNEGYCTLVITINTSPDTTPPVVICPSNITRPVLPGVTSLEVIFPTATATDESGTTSLVSVNPPSGSSFPLGPTDVRFTFEDDAGNEGYCTLVITINTSPDTTPPVVTCLADIDRSVPRGITSLEVYFSTATATDDSGMTSLVSVDPPSGSSFPLGPTEVRFVFQDEAGNEGNCSFVITITTIPDTTPPIVTCPPNITRYVPSEVSSLQVNFSSATATDDTGTTSLLSVEPSSGSSFPLGTTEVRFVFLDEVGNEGFCTFAITIIMLDTIPPEVTCPSNITRFVPQGSDSQRVVFPSATAIDNSGKTSFVSVDPPSGSPFPLGSTEVIFEYSDPRGNVGSCSFFITITPLGPTSCGGSTCENGATCVTSADSFQCACVPGFVGRQCEIDINECSSLPCMNGGTCIDGVDRFSCLCRQGFSGINCEKVEICDLEGDWYNECNDRLSLSPTSTGLILGFYHTNNEISTGYTDPTVVIGYINLKCYFSSFGFIVSWNKGQSTGGWSGQCHLCDGQEVLYTTWTTRLRVNTCDDTRLATRVGQDKWTRYQQHPAPREA